MPYVNRVTLIGNLGKDPELRYTPEGKRAVCTFSMATTRNYKDKNDAWVKETQWHNIVVWGPQAERCGETLKKGNLVYVEGRLNYRTYKDKNEQQRYITEIIADIWMSLTPKPAGERGPHDGEADSHGGGEEGNPTAPPPADDFPF